MNFPYNGFVQIHRVNEGDLGFQTPGTLTVYNWDLIDVFSCRTLEPQWNSNKESDSCMPNGWYWLVKRWSDQYKNHFEIQDVDYRTWMLLHFGNYRKNTEGCVLPGKDFIDIDGDGHKDVTSSKKVMGKLNELLPHKIPIFFSSEFTLETA